MSYSVYPAPVVESKGPLDITWTNISSNTANGVSSYTFSGISGYKMLKLVGAGLSSTSSNVSIRFNSDSSSNYYYNGYMLYNSTTPADNVLSGTGALRTYIIAGQAASGTMGFNLIIPNADATTAHKHWELYSSGYEGSRSYREVKGVYAGSSSISSITIERVDATNWSNTSPQGFYLYGAN
jgi:hypothetical protein